MASEATDSQSNEILDELGASFLEAQEGGDGTLDITEESNPSQTASKTDTVNETLENPDGAEETNAAEDELDLDLVEGVEEAAELEEEEGADGAEVELEDEAEVVDADVSNEEEKEAGPSTEKTPSEDSQKIDESKTEEQEEEEEAKENAEVEKQMAVKFDPNQMPQVNVSTLATRRWQIKVYPLRPYDFMSGQIAKVFNQAKESLLYLYTAGNNGKFSNGKAELYVSTISQAAKVMHNLIKMEFFHPETNIKIIRKNDAGAVVEKACMRFDTKMTSLLCQPSGPPRRVGIKKERIIGSVFLKNLPDGATKDMLRVMFPFAAEINFNPEKFKDSTARLVLSNRNGVIPCLKAFSKVELGGNILELRPLEKRDRSNDVAKDSQAEKKEKTKGDEKSSTSSKDSSKGPAKKDDAKQPAEKDAAKKTSDSGPSSSNQKGGQKSQGPTPKKFEPKRGRGGVSKASARSSRFAQAKFTQNAQQQQRWQDRQRRGGGGGAIRAAGRGSGFAGNNRNRFNTSTSAYRGAQTSPGRLQAGGMAGRSDLEMTKEMMQLQAQLNTAIKNQMSMLSQTQMALEQAKRGAAVSTAAAAAAMNAGSGSGMGFSRGANLAQEQYGRGSDQSRRIQATNNARQRAQNRGRVQQQQQQQQQQERQDNFRARGSQRERRGSSYQGKRNAARAGISDRYDDLSYAKRSNLGVGRSWAEETEDLDVYRDSSSLAYAGRAYADEAGDYGEDRGIPSLYAASARSGSNRLFGASARNLDYDYGY